MESPSGERSDHVGAGGGLESMDGDGPSAPSGAGPLSPRDDENDVTDASVASMPQDHLPAENVLVPRPWPQADIRTEVVTTNRADATSHRKSTSGLPHTKLFKYPETPGTGSRLPASRSRAFHDDDSDEEMDHAKASARSRAPFARGKTPISSSSNKVRLFQCFKPFSVLRIGSTGSTSQSLFCISHRACS